MPNKPLIGFGSISGRRTRPKTRGQKVAKSESQKRDERIANLAKARAVKKKNLTAKKKAAKAS